MSQISSTFDVVVPRTRAKVEPLCAVYSKNCLASIHNLLERDELRLSELLNMVKVRYIEEDEINRFDPEHLSFFNVNTQANLSKAKKLAANRGWLPNRS
jgi:molybdopterin-guanine dinucleotide biosynthesis protein A